MLRNEKNNMMINDKENEIIKNESVSRESSTDTIDFDALRTKHDDTSRPDIHNDNNNSDEEEEEEEEKEEEDIEKEIKNIISNNINKDHEDEAKVSSESDVHYSDSDLEDESKDKKEDSEIQNITTTTTATPEGDGATTTTTSTSTPEGDGTTTLDNKVESNSPNEPEKKETNGETNGNVTTDMVEPINKENTTTNEDTNKTEDTVEQLDDDNIFSSESTNSNNKKKKKNDNYYNITDYDDLESLPIKTIINPHNNCGVVAMKMSRDSKYLVTLGAGI